MDTSRGEDAAQLQPRGKQALLLRPGSGLVTIDSDKEH